MSLPLFRLAQNVPQLQNLPFAISCIYPESEQWLKIHHSFCINAHLQFTDQGYTANGSGEPRIKSRGLQLLVN